jgi:hypothetical protein
VSEPGDLIAIYTTQGGPVGGGWYTPSETFYWGCDPYVPSNIVLGEN